MFLVIGGLSMMSHHYTLGNIKSRTVGDGQHGTARWATNKEIKQTYAHVPFKVREWRRGQNLPTEQGLILGCKGQPQELTALVDSDDIHCLMIGASGIGKTAFFLYPNLEYACASGMSWLALDSKGDLARNYGTIAKNCYGYHVSVIDLRNPTRSDGNNLLTLVNRYMDIARKNPKNLAARAKAEKYSKILAKTIVNPDGDDSNRGQNAFFYDAAEGLLTSVILMLAEFLPPDEEHPQERRHIVSVFKLVQDLLGPSKVKGKSHFQLLMGKLPPDHKARWFAGAALNSAEQAMASVMSTVLSRLNAFLDSELEQVLCFDSAIDAEMLTNLQTIRNRRMLWSPDIVALNKRISDLTSQNQTLAFLKQQGLVDPDIFIAKTNELTKQLRQAKQEKEKLMDAESDMTALQTRDLIDLLKGGPEFLDSFDAELFGELVEKIIIESNDSVRFCLKNGLELRESIERTMR